MFSALAGKYPHISSQSSRRSSPNAEKLDKRGLDFVSLQCLPEESSPQSNTKFHRVLFIACGRRKIKKTP